MRSWGQERIVFVRFGSRLLRPTASFQRRNARMSVRIYSLTLPCPAPSRGITGLAGVSTRPAWFPHPRSTTSCRKAAPLTFYTDTQESAVVWCVRRGPR